MKREAAHQGAAVSKPPNRTLCNASLVTVGSYSTLSRNCRKRDSLTPECKTAASGSRAHQKSQTLSDKSQKLSTSSIQSLQLKIQTSFGKFRRRCLRNFESTATSAAVARRKATRILPLAHPASLWFCYAQMWRVFLFCSGGAA